MRYEDSGDGELLGAIAELRAEVDRLIEVERQHVLGGRVGSLRAGRPASRDEMGGQSLAGGDVRGPFLAARAERVEEPAAVPAARPGGDHDPGRRLDALAQRLEDRLRRGRNPRKDSPPAP